MSQTPDQVELAVSVLERFDPVVGIHLYGSSVVGGLRPDSDLDLLVVAERRLDRTEKRQLIDGLLPISGTQPALDGLRPLEVTVVARPDVVPWRYPPHMDLQYGEWLRVELSDPEAPLEGSEAPDLAIVLTMARATAIPLSGSALSELVGAVPQADVRRAMFDELPSLLDELEDDTRNVLLTLARIRVTMATDRIESKADAAAWVIDRLQPAEAAVMTRARDLYLAGGFGPWDDLDEVRRTAAAIVEAIR